MSKKGHRPQTAIAITVLNRQRAMRVPLIALREFAARAVQECLKITGSRRSDLARITEVNVVLISDRRMAELHRRFFNLCGPTDVITFQHGEIFISVETARRHARRFGSSVAEEVCLYIAHGLLHLHGFDDKNPIAAAKMERAQKNLVRAVGWGVDARPPG